MQQSQVLQGTVFVPFPVFNQERHYMVPFLQKEGLPQELSHWQPTVDAMLDGLSSDNPIYLMVDQAVVEAGKTHRRSGLHVDGYWDPGTAFHQPAHTLVAGGHSYGQWHDRPQWKASPHTPTPRHKAHGAGWSNADFSSPEALILASNIEGACSAYVGEYDQSLLQDGGNASNISINGLEKVVMKNNTSYLGTVGTLHESLPVLETVERTLVRLNCPGISIN